jgi:hypothetical protein
MRYKMKKLLNVLFALGSISAVASDNNKCKDAITDATITASLLKEYQLKRSISPEMEEHVSKVVVKLTKQLPRDIEAAVNICGEN